MPTPPLRARTDDGLELPVLDITHPAFALAPGELDAQVEAFLAAAGRWSRAPRWLTRWILPLLAGRSRLVRAVAQAEGSYLAGLETYAMKLGPDQLPPPTWTAADRRLAAALPGRMMRQRVEDVARLLAGGLAPALRADPRRPLHLVDLAGGVGADAFNTLILLARDGLLAGRPVALDLLDLDPAGPAFGLRAIEALCGPEGPLDGVAIAARAARHDWSGPVEIVIGAGALGAVASEGGLFEYADDDTIVRHLVAARSAGVELIAGSVTRDDGPAGARNRASAIQLRPRSAEAFAALAEAGGWAVADTRTGPLSRQVRLSPRER